MGMDTPSVDKSRCGPCYHINIIIRDMWSFAASMFEKVVGFSPVKTVLQNLFQKFSKDFLDQQPLFTFKEGMLELGHLELSSAKINQAFLAASPYVLAHGKVSSIKITLPSSEGKTSKSLQVKISGVELVMEPNRHFKEAFEMSLNLIKEEKKAQPQEEASRDTSHSLNFFKRMIQEFLTNIKIEVDNVVIKWLMSAEEEVSKKCQHFLTVRIPRVVFDRVHDMELGKISEDFIKYRLQVPQVSAQLTSDGANMPENKHSPQGTEDDSVYTSVRSPNTIFLIGRQYQSGDQKITVSIRISKDIKTKTKQYLITAEIPNVQSIIEPKQLIILYKYSEQIRAFREEYDFTIQKLKGRQFYNHRLEQSTEFQLADNGPQIGAQAVRTSMDLSKSIDIFSSYAFSINNLGNKTQRQSSYLQSLVGGDSEIQEQLNKIQKEAPKDIKSQVLNEDTFQFKHSTVFKLTLGIIRLYVVKCETSSQFFDYQRVWTMNQQNTESGINLFIKSGYILVRGDQLTVIHETTDMSQTTIKLKSAGLLDVRLKSQHKAVSVKNQCENPKVNITESVDIFKSFESIPMELMPKQLLISHPDPTSGHYCSTSVLSFQPNNHASIKSGIVHKHNQPLPPRVSGNPNKNDNGIVVKIQRQQKTKIHMSVNHMVLCLQSRFIQDLIAVTRPLLIYRAMLTKENKDTQSSAEKAKKQNKVFSQSIYDFNTQLGQSPVLLKNANSNTCLPLPSKKTLKNEYIIDVDEIYCLLRGINNFTDPVQSYKTKSYDYDIFQSQCYCGSSPDGLHLGVSSLSFRKSALTKIQVKQGSIKFVDDDMNKTSEYVVQVSSEGKLSPRVSMETLNCENITKKTIVGVHIPKVGITISQSLPKRLLKFSSDIKTALVSLSEFNSYLKEEIDRLSGSQLESQAKQLPTLSKGKMAKVFNIYVQKLGFQFLSYELLVNHVICRYETQLKLKVFQGILIKCNQPQLKLQNPWKEQQSCYYSQKPQQDKFTRLGVKSGVDRIVAYIEKTQQISPIGQMKDREYFEALEKLPAPIMMTLTVTKNLSEQQQPPKNSKVSPGFQKPKYSESTLKSIDIAINTPLIVKLCELRDFKQVKMYFDHVKNMVKSSDLLKPIRERRKSSQDFREQCPIGPDTMEDKIMLKVITSFVYLDAHPYAKSGRLQEVVSHTRSMIAVDSLEVYFDQGESRDKRKKVEKLRAKWRQASQYFLTFQDCHLELNKEVISFSQIEDFGFKRMMDLRGEIESIVTKTIELGKQVQLSVCISELDCTISSKTLGDFGQHIGHIVSNFKDALAKLQVSQQQGKQDQVSSDPGSESSAEDFDQIQKRLTILQQKKLRQQEEFKTEPIKLRQRSKDANIVKVFSLNHLFVRKVFVKITDKSDYEFFNYISKGDNGPFIIQLDGKSDASDDLVIGKQQASTHKRYRSYGNKEGVILKILFENSTVFLDKYVDKLNPQTLNMCIVVDLKAFESDLFLPGDDPFTLVRAIDNFQALVNVQDNKISVKTTGRRLHLGFTSAMNFLRKDIKQANKKNRLSIFNRQSITSPVIREEKGNPKAMVLMFYLPQMSVQLNLKLIGWQFINNQQLQVPQFLFQNALSKYMQEDNRELLKDWIKTILTSNLGGLLGNGLTNIVSNSLVGLLICAKQILLLPSQALRILHL